MADKEKATAFRLSFFIDGEEFSTEMVEKGTRLSSAPKPKKDFYTFTGWDKIPSRMPARDVEVNGHFVPNEYNLTFVADGKEISAEKLAYGAAVTAPDAPELEGCTFVEWRNLPATMPGQDTEVVAFYEAKTYHVRYIIKDGNGQFGDTVFTFPCLYGEPVPDMDVPQRLYYSFSGWSERPELMPAEDITVTGTLAMTLYKLTRIVDGEIFKEEYLPYGAPVSKKPNPEKEGYYFSGFRKLPKVMPDHDVEVVSSMYPARYKADFFIDEILYDSKYIPFGYPVDFVPEPKKGYVFEGWSDCPETMPASDIEVHGKMVRSEFQLIYRARGKEVHTDTYSYGDAVVAADPVEMPGFVFLGWKDVPPEMPNHDMYIDGEYRFASNRVSFILDGQQYATFTGDEIQEPIPEAKEGYTFDGWKESVLEEDGSLSVSGKFVPNVHTVSYVIDEETVATETLSFGQTLSAPDAPVKDNMTFIGWKDMPDAMPDRDLTLVGEYADAVYRIEFVIDGTIVAEFVKPAGAQILAPEAPAKEGYSFTGWLNVPAEMPEYDVIVNGEYKLDTYRLTYLLDGELYSEQSLAFGEAVEAPVPESKDGQNFIGWENLPETMPASDLTINGYMGSQVYVLRFTVDGELFEEARFAEGTATEAPAQAPEKEGYRFLQWSGMPDVMPANDTEAQAEFAVNEYTVTFTVADETVATLTVPFGAEVVVPEDLTVNDPAFDGWVDLPDVMPASDVVVSANMNRASYTLTYTIDGETVQESQLYPDDEVICPEIAQREGYTFAGWRGYMDKMPAHDLEIAGFYMPNSHTISYMVGGELFTLGNALYGTTPVVPAVPEKAGYRFVGFDGLPAEMPNEDISVSALFETDDAPVVAQEKAEGACTVRFTASGETVAERYVMPGFAVEAPKAPYKYGYTFVKWDNLPEEVEVDTEVRAHYKPNAHHILYLENNIVRMDQVVNYGDPVVVPDQLSDENIVAWNNLPSTMPDANVVVNAVFAKFATTVTFTVNGEVYHEYYAKIGEAPVVPALPEKEGYDLVCGWENIPDTVGEEPLTFDAQFAPHIHNVIYMCCGEEVSSEKVPFGAEIKLPELNRYIEGILYDKWGEHPATMPDEDVVIYAEGRVSGGVVTYVCEDAVVDTVRYAEGATLTGPQMPEREGCTFDGWKEQPAVMANGDITVVGSYVPNVYTVTYKVKGQLYKEEQYAFGAAIEPLKAPVIKKRAFVTWSGLPSVMPAENIVTEGLYNTQNTFLLSFRIDGEPYAESVLEPGTRILMPAPPVKPGFVFSGWDKNVSIIGREPIIVNGSFTANVCTVIYYVGEAEYARYEVAVGDPVPVPEAPATDLTFCGWTQLPKVMPNMNLEAHAKLGVEYTVVFMAGGSKIAEYVLREKEAVTVPDAPEKEGFLFEGWDNLPEIAEADVVCTAKYKPCVYNVTFEVEGEVYAKSEVTFGHAIELPEEPAVDGKTFNGWLNLPQTMPAADITISASLEGIPVYTITFLSGEDVVATYEVRQGQAIVAPDAPEKEGFLFEGWDNLPEIAEADVVCTAKYKPCVYNVTFEVEGEVYAKSEVTFGHAIELPEEPAVDGKTFNGWLNLPQTMPAADITISASLEGIPVYTITFLSGEDVVATCEVRQGEPITAPDAPEKVGYTFSGWGDVPEVASSDVTIHANYTQNTYTVSFTVDGEAYASVSALYGEELILPVNPEKEGYEFKAWENLPQTVSEDVTCNAIFEEVAVQEVAEEPEAIFVVPEIKEPAPVYKVTFLVAGDVYACYELEAGQAIVPPEAPETALTFVGWAGLPEVMGESDITVEAVLGVEYTVIFKTEDETVAEYKVKEGEPILPPEAPEKDGYTFVSWNALTETAQADLECTAVYEPKLFALSYNVEGEAFATFTVPYGAQLPMPEEAPEREGMQFIGWGELPEFMPMQDMAAFAQFEEVVAEKVSVIFKLDGELYHATEMNVGEALTCPVVGALANRIFKGWGEIPATVPAMENGAPFVIEGFSKPMSRNITYIVRDEVYAVNAAPVGEPIELPEAPQLEDMRFVGWNALPAVMPDEDITLTADFACANGKVRFIADGEVISELSIAIGDAITVPEVEVREGYTFSGFGDVPATLDTETIDFEGIYIPNVHKVSFFVKKKLFAQVEVAFGEAIILPEENPTKKKLTFMGWGEIPESMPDCDLEFTAIFKRTVPVEFHVDGELYETVNLPIKTRIVPLEMPEREGYTFSGWSAFPKKVGKKKVVICGAYNANTYTVTYMVENEVYQKSSVRYGETIEVVADPVKDHANFLHWEGLPETMPAEDVTAVAVFETGRYKVSFILDGVNVCEIEEEVGDAISYPTVPKKPGHTFAGWDNVPARMPATHLVINGTYDINIHTIRFIAGKNVFYEEAYPYGAAIEIPASEPISKKKKKLFYKWSDVPATMGDSDIEVHAVFESKRKLKKLLRTVTFYVDGKSYAETTALPGRRIELPKEPEKRSLVFDGWENLPELMPENNIKVNARFIEKECTVTFVLDGEEYYSITLPVGAEVPNPVPAARVGYLFSGWSNYASIMPDYDFVVTGSYRKDSYTVTYMANDKVFDTISYECGEVIVSPIPAETYTTTFVMWQGLPATMPTQNITVYALFRKKEYKVTYIVDNKVVATNYVAYGNTIIPPAFAPNKRGKVIVDWRNMPVYDLMPARDVVLEAIWGSEYELRRINKKKKKKVKKPIYTIYEGYLYKENGTNNAVTDDQINQALIDKLVKEECRKRMRRLMR